MLSYFGFCVVTLIVLFVISLIVSDWFDSEIPVIVGFFLYLLIILAHIPQVEYRDFTDPKDFERYIKIYVNDIVLASNLVSQTGVPITYELTKKNRSIEHNMIISKLIDEQSEGFATQLYSLAFSRADFIPENVTITSTVTYTNRDAIIFINIARKE